VEQLTFSDLALLQHIDETTVVEKFGTVINSSFFDAANLLGTLKQKGYVEIIPQFPGPSRVVLTEKGKGILTLAKEKGAQEIEKLDEVIISLIANGFKDPKALTEKLNMRSSDVAFHLQRLVMQDYASYVFKSGRVELNVTDAGFKLAGYPPLATEEERKKESEDIEAIIEEHHPPAASGGNAPDAPVKLNRETKIKAKLEYYLKDAVKYAFILLALLLAVVAAVAYYLLFMH